MPKVFGDQIGADLTTNGQSLYLASDLDIAKALAHALAVPALPAPEPIDVEAVPVCRGGRAAVSAKCICGRGDTFGRSHTCPHPDGPRWSDAKPVRQGVPKANVSAETASCVSKKSFAF